MISIIIPIFNTPEAQLRRTINSVLCQTYKDYEVLLIDDGSDISTSLLIDELSNKDSRISVFHKDNRGVSSARNVGIELSKGEYICFLDADDEVLPNYFSDAIHFLDKYDLDCVYGGFERIEDNNKSFRQINIEDTVRVYTDLDVLKCKIFVDRISSCGELDGIMLNSVWGALFKKKIIADIRFNELLKISEDRVFNYEVFNVCHKVGITNNLWYRYYINAFSAGHQYRKHALDEMVNTATAFYQLINTDSITECVYNSIILGIFDSYYQFLAFSIIHPKCSLSYKEKIKTINESLNEQCFAEMFNQVQKNRFKDRIFVWFGKHKIALGIYCYSKMNQSMYMIRRKLNGSKNKC